MDAEPRVPRRWKMPAGVIGMLALVAAVETFVTRHDLDAISPDDWQYVLARRDAARRARSCDLLIFGDSQAKFGILPKVVGPASGLRPYNLAIWGGQSPASYDVFRRVLRGGARPSAVVVNFYPLLLAKPPRASRSHLPFLLDPGSALRLAVEAHDGALLIELVFRRSLPSFRSRDALRSWLQAAFAGRTNRYRLLMPEALRHWADNDGALVVPSYPERPISGVDHQRLAYPRRWKPDRVNADYVRRFLRLAEANGVAVYWLIPPVHPTLQATLDTTGFDERYTAFIKLQQREFPGLLVIDGRHTDYAPSVFLDADHLGREGAFAMSEDLGELLRRLGRSSPPSRWVALPRYRARPTAPDVLAARLDVFLPEPAPSISR